MPPWTILECRQCGFSKLDPVPLIENRPEFYSKNKVIERNVKKKNILAKTSSFIKGKTKRWLNRDKNDLFSKKIRGTISPGKSILDIGCGDGSFLERLKHDYDCSGIELSRYLGTKAQSRGKINVYIGDYLSHSEPCHSEHKVRGIPSHTFHAVTMISLIEHLPDPKYALQTCFNLLKPSGLFLLKTVNYTCVNRYVMGKRWTGFRPPDHLVYFSPKTLRKALTHIGFSKVKVSSNPFNDNMYAEAWK